MTIMYLSNDKNRNYDLITATLLPAKTLQNL